MASNRNVINECWKSFRQEINQAARILTKAWTSILIYVAMIHTEDVIHFDRLDHAGGLCASAAYLVIIIDETPKEE